MQQYKVTKVKHHYELVITVKDYKLYMYGLLRHDIRWFPHKKVQGRELSALKRPLCFVIRKKQRKRRGQLQWRFGALPCFFSFGND